MPASQSGDRQGLSEIFFERDGVHPAIAKIIDIFEFLLLGFEYFRKADFLRIYLYIFVNFILILFDTYRWMAAPATGAKHIQVQVIPSKGRLNNTMQVVECQLCGNFNAALYRWFGNAVNLDFEFDLFPK